MSYLLMFESGPMMDEWINYVARRLLPHFIVERDEALLAEGLLTAAVQRRDLEFEATHLELLKPLKRGRRQDEFDYTTREEFEGVDDDAFFSPAEQAHIADLVLHSLKVDEEFLELEARAGGGRGRRGGADTAQFLVPALLHAAALRDLAPLHQAHLQRNVFRSWTLLMPVEAIRGYYGEEVALYFAWMNHFTVWLVPPALAGLLCFAYARLEGQSVDNNKYMLFFSLGMVLWAAAFNKFWARRSCQLASDWGTLAAQQGQREEVRPEFQGPLRRSPVSGLLERSYPPWRRLPWYAVSTVVTAAMLGVAVVVMTASLNLQGYIRSGRLHVPLLARFSAPGAIFDPVDGHALLCLIPTVIHALTIMVLNQLIYRRIAIQLTEWENHRTEEAHENSLILKRFLFEAFDCYISLFYLAFYELDVIMVRKELVSLYTADCVRRLVTETLIPLGLQRAARHYQRERSDAAKRRAGEKAALSQASEDAAKDRYESFDDYLEMVIQFGYVTMFASAFPLASALSLVYNLVEMRSDAVKLTSACQRPPSRRATNIGTWHTVLQAQTLLAVLTNALMFGFASDQMEQWLPHLFLAEGDGLVSGKGRYVVAGVFCVEHMMALGVAMIFYFIPDTPLNVELTIKKRAYEREQEYLEAKQRKRKQLGKRTFTQ